MALDFSACRRSFFFFIRAGLALSQFLPVATVLSHSLRHYLRAHGYKWAGPRATRARCRSLVDESHSTSARAAVGGDQDLILITCRYTGTRTAIDTDNANRISASRICRSRGTGRARLASFARRPAGPGSPLSPVDLRDPLLPLALRDLDRSSPNKGRMQS